MNYIEALYLFFVFNSLLFWLIASFNLGPNMGEVRNQKILFIMYMLLLLTFSIFLIFSVIFNPRNIYWVYFAGASILITTIYILIFPRNNFVHVLALLLPLTVITTSYYINGFLPIGPDEGRYAGFASIILQNGKWIPFQYPENNYYQYFHLLPSLEAILSAIAGMSPIYQTHSILALYQVVLISLAIYAIAKRVLKSASSQKFADLVFVILLATPPISPLDLIPRSISATMYIYVLLLTLMSLNSRNGPRFYIPMSLMAFVGIISHAIFSILLLVSFSSILILLKIYRERDVKASTFKSALKLVIVYTTTYWLLTSIIDMLVMMGENVYTSFINLLITESQPAGFKTSWYSSAPLELSLPWTLLPSLTSIFIIIKLIHRAKGVSWRKDYIELSLGFSGLLLLLFGFVTYIVMGGLGTYFYSGYFLLIPSSIKLLSMIAQKRKLLLTVILVGVISMSAFYGIQDSAYSPDILKIFPTADSRSWSYAETLSQYLSTHVTILGGPLSGKIFYSDERVAIGISALMIKQSENISKGEIVFVVGSDKLGTLWAQKYFPTTEWNNFDKVLTDGLYDTYII